MYSSSRADLTNILRWLRGHDESQWSAQAKLLSDSQASALLDCDSSE
jgi:hypothetical protein